MKALPAQPSRSAHRRRTSATENRLNMMDAQRRHEDDLIGPGAALGLAESQALEAGDGVGALAADRGFDRLLAGMARHSDPRGTIVGHYPSRLQHWIGLVWRVGKVGLPINTQLQAFYKAETPEFGPEWQLRFQVQFLFPR
jgi:hypothetical protein